MPQAVLLLPGIGAQGAKAGRPRARVHERPGERARQRLALGHLRLPGVRRGLPRRGGRRGGAGAAGDLGGVRLVGRCERGEWMPVSGQRHPRSTARLPSGIVPLAGDRACAAEGVRRPGLLLARRSRSWPSARSETGRLRRRRATSRGRRPTPPPALLLGRAGRHARRDRAKTGVPLARSERLNPGVAPTALFVGRRSACGETLAAALLAARSALPGPRPPRRRRRMSKRARGSSRTPPPARCSRPSASAEHADRLDHEADDGARRARHGRSSPTSSPSTRARPRSGGGIYLRAGEQLTVRDLAEGGADPVGEQRCRRARARRSRPTSRRSRS